MTAKKQTVQDSFNYKGALTAMTIVAFILLMAVFLLILETSNSQGFCYSCPPVLTGVVVPESDSLMPDANVFAEPCIIFEWDGELCASTQTVYGGSDEIASYGRFECRSTKQKWEHTAISDGLNYCIFEELEKESD